MLMKSLLIGAAIWGAVVLVATAVMVADESVKRLDAELVFRKLREEMEKKEEKS